MYDFTGGFDHINGCQGGLEYRHLSRSITRRAHRAAKGMFNRRNAGHTGGSRKNGNIGEGDRRETCLLNFVLNQSNGPGTNRSGWDQYNDIYRVFL